MFSRRHSQAVRTEVGKMRHVQTAIIGAGPTGLGAAWRLNERGDRDWLVLEQADRPGGAAASVTDNEGFTWDMGGHVIHSHYPYFDQVLAACDITWSYPQRNGVVHIGGDFIPVPLQQNISLLPAALRERIERELNKRSTDTTDNLQAWFQQSFGATLSDLFFTPFNTKMWGHPPHLLAHDWTSLRSGSQMANVPQPRTNSEPVVDRTCFPYPRNGSGAMWQSVANELPAQMEYDAEVVEILPADHILRYTQGGKVYVLHYDHLISTMPLTELLRQLHKPHERHLLHSSVDVMGFGFAGDPPAALADKSWVYDANPETPFHRATVLSNYSPAMAGEERWSILLECGTSQARSLPEDATARNLAVLQTWGAGDPVSIWRHHLPLGYPVPSVHRDHALAPLMAELVDLNVRSRGRFGGWRYESCNQDNSFMQGVEAVDAGLDGASEEVFWPAAVSS